MEWIAFYTAIADKLANFANRRADLFGMVGKAAQNEPLMHYLHFEKRDLWAARDNQIDPFTVMGIFNRGVTAEHRQALAKIVAEMCLVTLEPPKEYHGIPYLDPRKSIYDGNDEMWKLFEAGLDRADDFSSAYDDAKNVRGNALGTLSIGLFWMRPRHFMPVDSVSIPYIAKHYKIEAPAEKCSGTEYLDFMARLSAVLPKGMDYPALAHAAWQEKQEKKGN